MDEPTDEQLMASLADDPSAALRELHRRYAPLVFTIAARIVGRAVAEDVVQDVFVTVWNEHARFDPQKGKLRPWLAQIARRRALNEARRLRVRRAEGDDALAEIADDALQPDQAQWEAHRRLVLHAALETLPEPQRRAVSLAYLDELTSEQVAHVLRSPVGTAKTRIRLALRRLAPMLAAVAVVLIAFLAWPRDPSPEARALRMVTASDVVPIRLSAAEGVPSEAHGNYRAHASEAIAVLTTSGLPPGTYVAWARHGDRWIDLGSFTIDADGRSLLVAEDPSLVQRPDELRVTRGGHDDAPVLRSP